MQIELLKPSEVAQLLRVKKPTVWKFARNGLLRVVRLNSRNIRFYKADVERMLESKAVDARATP